MISMMGRSDSADHFHGKEGGSLDRFAGSDTIPGAGEAFNLMASMEGTDLDVWVQARAFSNPAAAHIVLPQTAAPQPGASQQGRQPTYLAGIPVPPQYQDPIDSAKHLFESGGLEEWRRQNNIVPRTSTFIRPENRIADVNGPNLPDFQPPWPTVTPQRMLKRPWLVLLADLKHQRGEQVSRLDILEELPSHWIALTDDQRAVYEAHSELLKQRTWAQLGAETGAGKRKYNIFR